MGGACSEHYRDNKLCKYRTLVENPEGKKPFVRPRHRWNDNIKMNIK
jgi:hypothetical protein